MKKGIIFASFVLTLLLSTQSFASSYYGPTVANDRLYRIALALQPSPQVDVQQVMVSIYKRNPYAFIDNNINGLYAGVLLYIPSLEEIAQVGTLYAHNLIKQHNTAWKNIHPRLVKAKKTVKTASPKLVVVKQNNISSYTNNAVSLQHEHADVAKEQAKITIPLKQDDAHTIFTSLDEDEANSIKENTLPKVAAQPSAVRKPTPVTSTEVKVAEPVKAVVAKSEHTTSETKKAATNIEAKDLHKMQQQLAVLQIQLAKLLAELKQQHPHKNVQNGLQHKYALFDSSRLQAKNSYYPSLLLYSDKAYIEWIIAAIMTLVTLGLAVTSNRQKFAEIAVDMESDEYDYIGSADGIPMKLNLAKAYCEMGNGEKAKKTLEDVIANGNNSQKLEAKELLAEIEQK